MSSACQDSSTRGIFQKVKDKNNYDQVIEEKKKTEICKNFLFKGSCKYQENCSFAHGDNELRDRVPANENFKTKPCKNYHKFGTCSYGLRCQYLHSEIKDKIKWWGYLQKQFKKNMVPFTFPWDKQDKTSQIQRIDILRFQRVFKDYQEVEQQLSYFKNLCV
ncbi:unnamed protein product [Paramecium primaurelia]|uniref:C3H1-type domain-containing protein n=2 Tax=Paramecium TaxID=5884 RepID=A0A8S1S9K8_9CILI|nr:unnamed protein product [Paramecium primaurelia]CAD8136946.1 unnamed protein product [Paramecium pentaurelia]